MAISRFRKTRKTPPDFRYYPYFPESYRQFIKTIPYENRIHVWAPQTGVRTTGPLEIEGGGGLKLETGYYLQNQETFMLGGDDATADGSYEHPFANLTPAVNYVVNSNVSAPFGKYAFIVYPGDYKESSFVNPFRKKYPDYRVNLFTDIFDNPIKKLPLDKRYTIEGKRKIDNYATHAFLNLNTWFYEFHYIGAGGNTRILYQNFPEYYDPVTGKYRDNFAVSTTRNGDKMSFLGLWPTLYESRFKTGGNNRVDQGMTFNIPYDGIYTIRYYVDNEQGGTKYFTFNTLEGSNSFLQGAWSQRYNYYFIDSDNTNPTGNVELNEVGKILITGDATIQANIAKFGNALALNEGGGALIPFNNNSVLDFGTSNCTIEFWVYLGQGNYTETKLVNSYNESSQNRKFDIYYTGDSIKAKFWHNNTFTSTELSTLKLQRDQWYWVVVQRIDKEINLLVNGKLSDKKLTVQRVSFANTFPLVYSLSGNNFIGIGVHNNFNNPPYHAIPGNVFIDEVRITKNARYPIGIVNNLPTDFSTNDSDTSLIYTLKDNTVALNGGTASYYGPIIKSTYTPFSESGNVAHSIMTTEGHYLRIPNSAELNLGSVFTVDFWIYRASTWSSNYTVLAKASSGSQGSYRITFLSTSVEVVISENGTNWRFANFNYNPRDRWTYVVISRSGTSIRLYGDGQFVDQKTIITSAATYNNTTNVTIGSSVSTGSGDRTGQVVLKNLRVRSNIFINSSSIAIPNSDPVTDEDVDPDTVLLVATSGNAFVDVSSYGHSITNTGNVSPMPLTPFSNSIGGSIFVQSFTRGLIHIKPSTKTDIINETAWTMELFVKLQNRATNSYAGLVSNAFNGYLQDNNFRLYVQGQQNGTGKLFLDIRRPPVNVKATGYYKNMSGVIELGTFASCEDWNHIVWENDNGVFTFYVNGQLASKLPVINSGYTVGNDVSGNPLSFITTDGLVLAPSPKGSSSAQFFKGYLHGFRLTKSIVYGAPFAALTTPLEELPDTTLLLFDKQLDTSTSNTGDGSISFSNPPSGSCLIQDQTPSMSHFTTNNFTVEAFVKFNSLPLLAKEAFGNTGTTLLRPQGSFSALGIGSTNLYTYRQVSGSGVYKTTGFAHGISTGVWYHIAFERMGNNMYYYIDGSLLGSEDISNAIQFFSGLNIPTQIARNIDGAVNNFRISNTARYGGSSFIIPTSNYVSDSNTKMIAFQKTNFRYIQGPAGTPTTLRTINGDTILSYYGDVLTESVTPFGTTETSNEIKIYGSVTPEPISPITSATGGSHFFFGSEIEHKGQKFDFDNNDWTIELYHYKFDRWLDDETLFFAQSTTNPGEQIRVVARPSQTGGGGFIIAYPAANRPDLVSTYAKTIYANTRMPKTKVWHHYALVKNKNSLGFFIDGRLELNIIPVDFKLNSVVFSMSSRSFKRTTGLVSNFRVSKIARYQVDVPVPTAPFSSNALVDTHFANVGALVHFDSQNYKYRPTRRSSSTIKSTPSSNWGSSQKRFLTAGQHTMNVSAIAFFEQGSLGWEIIDKNGTVVDQSRNDPRDNGLGYFRHPESTVRGFHVRYAGSKPEFYQNALINQDNQAGSEPYVLPEDTENGLYDPRDLAFTVNKGRTKTVPKVDPDTKSVTNETVTGKLSKLQVANRGTYINCGIEGINLTLDYTDGRRQVEFRNCSFRFSGVGKDTSVPTAKLFSSTFSASGNVILTNCVFTTPLTDAISISLNSGVATAAKTPGRPERAANSIASTFLKNAIRPIFRNSFLGASIAANTFVITNASTIIPNRTQRSGLTFDKISIIKNEGGVAQNLTLESINGNLNDFRDANVHGGVSLYFSPISKAQAILPANQNKPNGSRFVRFYPGILPAQTKYWSIKFHIYHEGSFDNFTDCDMIMFNGDYRIKQGRSAAQVYENSFLVWAQARPFNYPLGGVPTGDTRFGIDAYSLNFAKFGDPVRGQQIDKIEVPRNIPKYLLKNRWYDVNIVHEDNYIKILVDNELYSEYDITAGRKSFKAPQYSMENNNTRWFILGRPPFFDNFSIPPSVGASRFNSWRGYIQYVRCFTGSEVPSTNIGVYGGAYKWVL